MRLVAGLRLPGAASLPAAPAPAKARRRDSAGQCTFGGVVKL